MGSNNSKLKTAPSIKENNKYTINIATLNYGVTDCPFQYSTLPDGVDPNKQQQILVDLNNKFKQIFFKVKGKHITKEYNWQAGKIEKKFKVNRYSPLYYPKIGIEKLNFLMNRNQFTKTWFKAFQKFKSDTTIQIKQEEVNNTQEFDWICYHTIVSYVYSNDDIDQVVKTQNAEKYRNFMNNQFKKRTIDENYKIQKMFNSLDKFGVDIFFLQEASNKILQVIQKKSNKYRIVSGQNSDSIILISWNLCEQLLGKYAYKTLKFYNDCYIKYADLFVHKAQLMKVSKTESNYLKKRQSSFDKTNSGAFIGAQRTFSGPQPQPDFKIKHKLSELQVFSLKRGQSLMQNIYEQNVRQSSSSSSSSSDDEEEQKVRIMKNSKNRIYLPMQTIDKFNFNGNSVVQFLGNLILFSVHLSSAKNNQKKREQLKDILQTIKQLKSRYPHHIIIMGGAFNQSLDSQQFEGMNIYPQQKSAFTVYKKRSYLQGQASKANVQVKQAFDYLVCSNLMEKGKIVNIDNEIVDEQFSLIPNQKHPYDHYIVSAKIQFERDIFNLRKTK